MLCMHYILLEIIFTTGIYICLTYIRYMYNYSDLACKFFPSSIEDISCDSYIWVVPPATDVGHKAVVFFFQLTITIYVHVYDPRWDKPRVVPADRRHQEPCQRPRHTEEIRCVPLHINAPVLRLGTASKKAVVLGGAHHKMAYLSPPQLWSKYHFFGGNLFFP